MPGIPTFDNVLEFIVDPERGVIFFVSMIVAVGLVIALWMLKELRPVSKSLHESVHRLRQYDSEESFAKGFEEFNRWVAGHKLLGAVWKEYVETLVFPRREQLDKRIGNTIPSADVFTRESILSDVNIRFYASVPNILTGLGILGTFVGLVAGIYLASDGLGAGRSIDEMRPALSNLLNGAALAFLTSIAGLACSLAFNGIEKRRIHRVDGLISQWNARLDSLLHRVTSESIAAESLHEAREQRKQLERFNTDLALQIAGALDEKIAGRLAPQVDRLITAVEGMRSDQSERISAALEGAVDAMAGRLEEAIAGAAGAEMRQLAESLTAAGQRLEATAASMSGGQQQLVGGMTSFSGELRGALQRLAEELASHQIAASQSLNEHMDTLERKMGEIVGGVRDAFDEVNRQITVSAQTSAEEFSRQRSASEARVRSVQLEISAGVETTLSKLVESGSVFEQLAEKIKNSIGESASSASQMFGDSVQRTQSLIEQAQSALERNNQTFDAFDASIERLSTVHRNLGETVSRLAGLPDAVSSAVGAASKVEGNLSAAVEAAKSAFASIEQEHRQMTATFGDYEKRFSGVDESARRLFEQINLGLEAYTERVRAFTGDVETHLEHALSTLSGAIGEFEGSTEELTDAIENLVRLLQNGRQEPTG